MSTTTDPIVARDELIAEYAKVDETAKSKSPNQRAGIRAGIARRIAELEYSAFASGVTDFEPWQPPRKTSPRRPGRTDQELLAALDVAEKIRDNVKAPDPIRATAERHVARYRDALINRGVIKDDSQTAEKPQTDSPKRSRKGKAATGHPKPAEALDAVERAVSAAA